MKTIAPIKKELNVSQLSDLAVQAKNISETVHAPALPIATASPISKAVVTQSTNDPLDVQLYADASKVSPGTGEELPVNKSGDYFPINVDLSALGQPATPTTNTALTEEEKRKRTIIIASIILLLLIVLVAIYAMKKGK